tara:strand:- start:14944 stop:16644 length:1701 start_codon:yes stop_codon:yes gene_type:complete
MISRISTFLKLSKSIIKVLKPNETKSMIFNMILSVFNTFLELFSITTIVYLLLVISGQNLTESKISYLFNSILPEESLIISSAILMISVVLVKTVFQIIFTYYQEKISQQVQNRINNTLFIKFINSKYEDYINDSSPRIVRILSQESIKIGNQLISPFISIINESLLLFFVSVFIFIYDPLLGLVVYFVSISLIFYFSKFISSKVQLLGKIVASNNNSRIKIIGEAYRSFDLIKMYNFQKSFINIYKKHTKNITDAGLMNMFFSKLPKSIFELFIFFFLFGLILVLYLSQNNDLLISYLSILAVSVYKIIPSLNKTSSSLQSIQYFASPFAELVELINADVVEPNIKEVESFKLIKYQDLSFSYSKKKRFFNSIDFEIKRNDFIGIYGPSGSGKSTFIKIISGLLTPDDGKVLVDGKPINLDSLHNYFSYVPQDPFILDEDILTNISFNFNSEEIDQIKVSEVLKKVELYDKFKDKMDESLGENGIKVSGGQKQRIAIARALFFDKKVIVLDESTSNLDPETETKILSLLSNLNKDITIIFISHKHSSLTNCKELYEINNNKIYKQ